MTSILRRALVFTSLLTAACGGTPPARSVATPGKAAPLPAAPAKTEASPPVPRVTNAAGTIGGQPFVVASAVLLRPNAPFRKCATATTGTGNCSTDKGDADVSISTLRLFARAVSCAHLVEGDLAFYGKEPGVEIELQGKWPFAPGTNLRTGEADPKRDQIAARFTRGFATGAAARGAILITAASPSEGTIYLDLTTTNPNLPQSGSVSGTVTFVVCDGT